jgi:hypothetical protein
LSDCYQLQQGPCLLACSHPNSIRTYRPSYMGMSLLPSLM